METEMNEHLHLVYEDGKPVQPTDFAIQPDLMTACRKLLTAHVLRSQNRTIIVKDKHANPVAELVDGGVYLINSEGGLMRFGQELAQ
jgi:hypothetical protein